MSARVCGKRSLFEGLQSPPPTSASPAVAKKLLWSSHLSPAPPPPPPVFVPTSLINQLRLSFPEMENQLIEQTLEECVNDLDSAIKKLSELRIGYTGENLNKKAELAPTDAKEVFQSEDAAKQSKLPKEGAEWVELFVREMMCATSIDDARSRASRVLESLEKSISARSAAAENHEKENMMLKEQIQVVLGENSILKRAITIQYQHQKEYEDKNQQVQQLKQLLAQYQEQSRILEVNNYALSMHLRHAEQANSIPGRFHPDVF